METTAPVEPVRRTVFVTGATGQVGGAIARALVEQGDRVRLLARTPGTLRGLDDAEAFQGDLSNIDTLTRAMNGCSHVIHVAGAVSYDAADREQMHQTNVIGTRNMLDAAAAADVKRFLYTSSIAAIGHVPPGEIGSEDSRYNWQPSDIAYFDTKKAAEDLVLNDERLDGFALNPGIIFGAGDLGRGAIQMMQKIASGRVRAVPPGATTVVGLQDVVSGHLLALDRAEQGERYVLGSQTMDLRTLFEQIAEVVDVPPPTKTLSPMAFTWGTRLTRWWSALTGTTPAVSSTMSEILLRNRQYSWSKATRELGYTPTAFASSLTDCWAAATGDGAEERAGL